MTSKAAPKSRNKRKRTSENEDEDDMLCLRCARVFSQDGLSQLNSPGGFLHHTRTQLIDCATEGQCSLCQFIARWACDAIHEQGHEGTVIVRNQNPESEMQMQYINILSIELEGIPDNLQVFPFAEAANPAAGLIQRRPLQRSACNSLVFESAKDHIESCVGTGAVQGHQLCQHSKDHALPRRVLALSRGTDEEINVRLQINKVETQGSYLALSYCWGNTANKTRSYFLRENNISAFQIDISFAQLPKTIQDAVQVTLDLGFKYLWVDALCIIQDDRDDKDREISKMAIIYKNATVTIAASVSDHSSKGFLRSTNDDERPYLPPKAFTIPIKGGQKGKVHLAMEPYAPKHPLDKRGWALQEFMLSSRLLIFSDYELLWQCKETPLQSVTGTANGLEYLQLVESLPWMTFREESEPHFGAHEMEQLYLWKTIIYQYTERRLSETKDRLSAIEGITSELESVWSDRHLFGHWSRWFVQLLAWYKPEASRVATRHLHRAPSWSWASVDGVILHEELLDEECARIHTLALTRVVIISQFLMSEMITERKIGSVYERPDLLSLASTRETGDQECGYVLLGKSRKNRGRYRGVGLLVMKSNHEQSRRSSGESYRRIGLAIFDDMSIWNGVEEQEIVLEAKAM